MKKRIVSVFLVCIILVNLMDLYVYAQDIPDELNNLYARSAVLIDADSGRILFGKNENTMLPMASTTKIMTCIVALEHMDEEQICTVSEYAAKQPKVHLGMKKGEQYYLKDLLYSLMLESHNDSAVVIAEAIGSSVTAFSQMMNQKARDIGCNNTYFITPNGLDAEDETGVHSTTAFELALILRYCIQESPKKEEFLEITQCKSYQFTDINHKRNYNCYNHNAFLSMMEGALTGKTGYTNDAGYCYVGALRRGDRTFIVALLACGWPNNKNYKWKDTRKLMEYAVNNYKYRNIWQDLKIEKVPVENGIDRANIYDHNIKLHPYIVSEGSDIKVLMSDRDKVEVRLLLENSMKAPVNKGEKIGEIVYMINGESVKKLDVAADKMIVERNMKILSRYVIKEWAL